MAGDIDNGAPGLDLDDILKDIDYFIKPDPVEDPSGPPDASAWDQRTSPIASPIAPSITRPGDESRWNVVQPRARSYSRPPTVPPSPPPSPSPPPPPPPKRSQATPRPKKKGGFIKALNKVKEMFAKKFGGGNQPPPNLSDRLVPEREDEVKWYDGLFPKHRRPNAGSTEIRSTAKHSTPEQVREPPVLIAYVIYLPYSV